jgi:trehalose-phosphatase
VRALLAGQKRIFFLLDFDGTLAPLASSPHRVRFPAGVRSLLRDLRSRPRVSVAVLSGRSLPDVRTYVGLPALYYGGNHGLEIRGPGISFRHRGAVSARAALQRLSRRIRRDLRSFPAAVLENKGLTLSVHYRRVPRPHVPRLRRLLRRLQTETSALPVRWSSGHEVREVLPRVDWNKGAAALYLMRRLRFPFAVAVGDDSTDEDLFAALKGKGVSIRVGRKNSSRADYYVSDQRQVPRLLALAGAALRSAT